MKPRSFTFSGVELQEREGPDPQYDATPRRYRGLPLSKLLSWYGVPRGNDLALLHFQNGMIVPLPLARDVLDRVDAFLAQDRWVPASAGAGEWVDSFLEVTKAGAEERDRRPLRFSGNKLVVKSPWHPMGARAPGAPFSPWLHVDSLTGIELVQAKAYYRQFEVNQTPASKAGLAVFISHCQFCHGARSIGARYGWDFIRPIPLHTYRGPQNLFLHLRYREGDAPERGLMMPAFSDLGPKQAEAVHTWLEDLANGNMPAYQPQQSP